MSPERVTYEALLNARDLMVGVKLLTDDELRKVLGYLAREEASGWPADRVRGVCIVESSDRFCNGMADAIRRHGDHGSEVPS